jgi:calcineurin-like phosphoesterase family protein
MGQIFFTSDTHFGHKNIIRLSNRPFKATKNQTDIEVMNEAIVKNWNATVSPEDTVYHLGDVALGPIDESLAIIARLNGTKVLVTGNHDRNFRGGRRSASLEPAEWDERYLSVGFDRVYANVALSGFTGLPAVMLSHFPYNGDSHDGDRYDEFRATDSGCPIVHGHTHSDKVISYSERGTLQIHAGVDTWRFRPVSYQRIAEIIKAVTP